MAQPRKIIFYTHALAGGGAERVFALLASGLARRGHVVMLATDREASENKGFLDSSVELVNVGTGHASSILNLAKLIRQARPDIVMSALAASNFKMFCASLLAGAWGRTIQTLHGFYEVEPGLLSRLGYFALPISSRVLGATIAVSQALRDDLVARFHADRARTICIHNPIEIDADFVSPTRADLQRRAPLVLAVGRLQSVKSFDLLLKAFAALKTPNVHLALVGEGSEGAALADLAMSLGIADRVAMPGYVSPATPWYDKAACLVVSSKSESFGLTLVEAMARGVPVVSTDSQGPREVLGDGRFGTLVPFGDVAALAQAIDAALADPGDPSARMAYASSFALDPILDRYEAVMNRLSSQRPSPDQTTPDAA